MKQKYIIYVAAAVIIAALIFIGTNYKTMDGKTAEFVQLREDLRGELLNDGKYACCIKKSCTYCLDEGECDCLEKVMTGKHPCGECIGEILEGHGNPYIAKYFAEAISEKTGHKETIRSIIEEKYDIPAGEQL